MERTWSTDELPESERFAHWREIVGEAFVPVSVARGSDGGFRSRVTTRAVGSLQVSRIDSAPQSVRRTASHVAHDEGDSYFLNLPLTRETSATQSGQTARLSAGDFTIVDSRHPFELSFPHHFAQLSVQIPHGLLDVHRIDPATVATRIDGGSGAGALASGALRAYATDSSAVDRHCGRRIAEQLCGLIALALDEHRPVPDTPAASTRERLLGAALREIETSLDDPELTPGLVAQRLAVSPRYLHGLFGEQDMSFGRRLLHRRLEHGHELLGDPALAQRPVSQIARDVGFTDPSYFSRAFKARYGITPRLARDAHAR